MEPRTITVTGRGNVSVKPDITRVCLSISTVQPEYIDSYNRALEFNKRIKDIMISLKLDETLPKTTHFDISRKYESIYVKGRYDHQEFQGYELSQEIRIDLGMDKKVLGEVLSRIAFEISEAEISLSYTVSDSKQAQYDLIEDAARDSKEKASRMARAVGCELGDVLSINYSWSSINLIREENYKGSLCDCAPIGASNELDVEPDDLKASDDVTIVWEIKQN